MINKDLAKNIGTQMNGKILCPRKCIEGQELSTYGDRENELFCPHCEIDVKITITWNANSEDSEE